MADEIITSNTEFQSDDKRGASFKQDQTSSAQSDHMDVIFHHQKEAVKLQSVENIKYMHDKNIDLDLPDFTDVITSDNYDPKREENWKTQVKHGENIIWNKLVNPEGPIAKMNGSHLDNHPNMKELHRIHEKASSWATKNIDNKLDRPDYVKAIVGVGIEKMAKGHDITPGQEIINGKEKGFDLER